MSALLCNAVCICGVCTAQGVYNSTAHSESQLSHHIYQHVAMHPTSYTRVSGHKFNSTTMAW